MLFWLFLPRSLPPILFMTSAEMPPVEVALAAITAAVAIHTGHMTTSCPAASSRASPPQRIAAIRIRVIRSVQPASTPRSVSPIQPIARCTNRTCVNPFSSVSRYWILETAGVDMNSGPLISSSDGGLIACTTPQKCPALFPRSRNQRPPGQASSFIGIGFSGVEFKGPICSRIVSKTMPIGAAISSSFTISNV